MGVRSYEKLAEDEDSDTCLCGHTPIRELCYIYNSTTRKTAIVGNHCIQKFEKDDPVHKQFGAIHLIFQSSNRILKDILTSPNQALIDYALAKGVITSSNAGFYEDIARKRSLSEKQNQYKESLNQKILYNIVLSAKAAFQRLQSNLEATAGPKLIEYAFTKKVLTKVNYDFYMKIWDRAHSSLSSAQKKYKVNLNGRMISQLKKHFTEDSEKQRQLALSSREDSDREEIDLSLLEEGNITFRKRKRDLSDSEEASSSEGFSFLLD